MSEKDKPQEIDQNRCFIITPIGNENSEIRRKVDGVINAVLRPVLEEMNFSICIPHQMTSPGSISQQVISNLLEYELVIANLTGQNPNVMYELAVRHAVRKPVVIILEVGTQLLFDISGERVLFYTDDMFGVEKLKEELPKMIQAALADTMPNNPIYMAKADFEMQKVIGNSSREDILLQKINQMSNRLNVLALKYENERPWIGFIENDNPNAPDDFYPQIRRKINRIVQELISKQEVDTKQ